MIPVVRSRCPVVLHVVCTEHWTCMVFLTAVILLGAAAIAMLLSESRGG
jgi:hypothetical protein